MRTGVNFLFSLLLCWFLCSQSQLCSAADTLNTPTLGTSLVSASNEFELGFISIPSGSEKKYLGIWYHELEVDAKTVVWVANRDDPVQDSTPHFRIAEDGNLVVQGESGVRYWSSQVEGSSSSNNKSVKLLDSGNLVLMENNGGTWSNLWQSFHYPTDTFLPGMKMDENLTLTSWKDASNPGKGSFTFKMAEGGKYVVNRMSQLYYELDSENESPIIYTLLRNFTSGSSSSTSIHNGKFSNMTVLSNYSYKKTRLVMNYSREIQFLKWEDIHWDNQWKAPARKCDIHNFCGNFASCNTNNLEGYYCKCLPGFSSKDNQQQNLTCVRNSESCYNMTFLNLTNIKVVRGKSNIHPTVETEDECQSICHGMCQDSHTRCQAYSYNTSTYDRASSAYGRASSGCEIWRDFPTIQEDYQGRERRKLSLLVRWSDIAPTPKSCEPCGTYVIPYPLSTEPICGDPTYNRFLCDKSSTTGIVSFNITAGNSYRVNFFDNAARKFLIQTDDSFDCESISSNRSVNFPFSIDCGNEPIWVSWEAAPEPPCSKLEDCRSWPNSKCSAIGGDSRCRCNPNYKWNSSVLSCTQVPPRSHHLALLLTLILTGITILACIIAFAIVRKRKIAHKLDEANSVIQESLNHSERHVKGLIGLGNLEEKDIEGVDVPSYTFASIVAATDNFSDSNKLGRGGYGPVYKGRFPGGQDIAVKRLSSVSTQGLHEFKNEVVLIAKLQHRNLVRLRGYCIKGDEKILLYEYMANKSLDSFIFDRTRTLLLDWPMRFDIIVGIARGLLYLHQDSRLRVIHRDLKTSNILLDEDMNPKISDFGLAKIFGGKETEASTERVVGTYGYMAPEYALDGFFSIKSDVFSFGVVLLEIISGKKNTGFYQYNQISSLLGYAWRLWTENKLGELKDTSLGETCNEDQFIKCALVGLLCVQDEPGDRPTMFNVLTMLDGESATIPIPMQPTFFVNKHFSSSASSSSKPEISLQFDTSYQEGR